MNADEAYAETLAQNARALEAQGVEIRKQTEAMERSATAAERTAQAFEDIVRTVKGLLELAKQD